MTGEVASGFSLSLSPDPNPPTEPDPEFNTEVTGGPVAEPAEGWRDGDGVPAAGGDAVSTVVGADAPMPEA
ncbi:hypothetical protein ACIBL8_37140 [Streptomyces sp. NPDC050523]|uniref:hypothetical protein n=1 Tax=Streptomyces sp. NPDC050523 TaxID=3365622 RepID=UPI0037B84E4E